MRTLNDLTEYYPSLQSVSVVPSGLTKHRDGLYPLEPFSSNDCSEVIDLVEDFASKCYDKFSSHLFYVSDEMYIKAGRHLPCDEYYEDYAQIENGVGMIRSMLTEFEDEFNYIDEYDLNTEKHISIATGYAAYDFIKMLAEKIESVAKNIKIDVHKIENVFFGEHITVAGLITGNDIINQLSSKDLGDKLLLPCVMLRHEKDVFLDDVSLEELSRKLNTEISLVNNDGADFIKKIFE